jgi:dihydroorotate dehydrogenase
MTAYRLLFDHVLARTDPERAHHAAFRAIRAARPALALTPLPPSRRSLTLRTRRVGAVRPVEAMGLTFPNVLGLAAGFDKNALGIDALAALGFGHVEIGTVTGQAQPGNPKPRLFRLPADRGLLNRLGFNNHGAGELAVRLARGTTDVPIGVNIGKTKVTPPEGAVED